MSNDVHFLSFEETPPWESNSGGEVTKLAAWDGDYSTGGDEYFDDGYGDADVDENGEPISDFDESEMEIYKKAANFKKLSLVSGNNLKVDVKTYVKNTYGEEGLLRYVFAQHILKRLGLIPSDDVMLLLSCTKKAEIVIATAGAGKTTSLQLYLVISKMVDAVKHIYHVDPMPIEGTQVALPRILYLNYNRHNVQPILDKHRSVCATINKMIVENIDDGIESTTVHAFCRRWLESWGEETGITSLKIATDDERQQLWEALAVPRWKKFYNEDEMRISWELLDELYVFKTESMLEWDLFFQSAKFVDTGLLPDFVKACLKKYESMKKQMNVLDFTDYIIRMIELIDTNPKVRAQLHDRYRIIVADENQDFTALMNELLLRLYNPEVNRLIVVGDPDQTIYAFKGVSPDNVVRLYDRLEDVELLGLDTNYRCPDTIVESAKRILNLNVLRFDKPIGSVKTGGKIVKHSMSSVYHQNNEVLRLIKSKGESNYGKIVLTYRNNRSSIILGEELYYAGIPFNVLDDRRPFNNMVFKHIQSALIALLECDNVSHTRGLYRFLPVSKEFWNKIIDQNIKMRRSYLQDIILPDALPTGTLEAFNILLSISSRVGSEPCSDFIGALLNLYKKYYFNFLMKNPNPAIGDEDLYGLWLERSEKFWNRPYTFAYMQQELNERNVDKPDSITFSTFHGLKGLEFDYVIAIDFNDVIFPNYFSIEQRYPKNTAMEEKESENRLCYVLVTRAVKELHLFYNETDPSYYIDHICPNTGENNSVSPDVKEMSLGGVTFADNAMDAKLRFIQRLTTNRRR